MLAQDWFAWSDWQEPRHYLVDLLLFDLVDFLDLIEVLSFLLDFLLDLPLSSTLPFLCWPFLLAKWPRPKKQTAQMMQGKQMKKKMDSAVSNHNHHGNFLSAVLLRRCGLVPVPLWRDKAMLVCSKRTMKMYPRCVHKVTEIWFISFFVT